jgi:Arsenical resistance operon protein ArsD
MIAVRVFDPAMCCSTGVCGPSVDSDLVRFSADLDWLKSQGVSVERFNLAQQPAAFAEDQGVRAALEARGDGCLPLIQVDGHIRSTGVYPSRADLAAWSGLRAPSARSRIQLTAVSSACCAPAEASEGEPTPTRGKCC